MSILFWKKAADRRERALAMASQYAATHGEALQIAERFVAFIEKGHVSVSSEPIVARPLS